MIDLEKIKSEFLIQCPVHDFGILGACECPERDYRATMDDLVREVERMRAALEQLSVNANHYGEISLACGVTEPKWCHWDIEVENGTTLAELEAKGAAHRREAHGAP